MGMWLIDAEKVIRDLTAMKAQLGVDAILIDGMIDGLKRQPKVDAVEVVRCKDCKHSDDECHKDGLRYCMRGIKADDYNETGYIYPVEEVVRDVDYCSYGERRTEENGDS